LNAVCVKGKECCRFPVAGKKQDRGTRFEDKGIGVRIQASGFGNQDPGEERFAGLKARPLKTRN